MRHKERQVLLFDGWVKVRTNSMPQIAMTARGFGQGCIPAISRQPAQNVIVLNILGKPAFRGRFADLFTIEELARIVCLLWRHTALIRYSELWGPFTTEKFARGMLGTPKLRYWIVQIVRERADKRDFVKMVYTSSGKWAIADFKTAYSHIRRWSEIGIQAAQRCAWKQTKARNAQQ